MKLQRDVYIAGVGETVFRKHKLDFDALGRIAARQAMEDANIDKPGIVQSAYVGNAHNGLVTGQTIFKDLGMLSTLPIIQRGECLFRRCHGSSSGHQGRGLRSYRGLYGYRGGEPHPAP